MITTKLALLAAPLLTTLGAAGQINESSSVSFGLLIAGVGTVALGAWRVSAYVTRSETQNEQQATRLDAQEKRIKELEDFVGGKGVKDLES